MNKDALSEVVVCRCEEVTRGEVVEVIRRGARSVAAVKRRTSAGLGLCHGRTCTRQIAQVLKEEAGIAISELKPSTVRPPVRPILLTAFEEEE